MANYAFCAQLIFCVSVQVVRTGTGVLRNFCEHFFIALGSSTMCEFSKTNFFPNRTMFDQLAAFQSCPKSANFEHFDNFHKKMLILGNFGKLPIGQILHCPIRTNFVMLNSHRVYLPRAIQIISQKFQSTPVRTSTRKIWFARKMQN